MRTTRHSVSAFLVVPLASAALLLAACGSSTPQASPTSSSTSTSSPASATTSTTTTTPVSPVATPSAIAACNADAQSVETAVESYDALKGTWPTAPSQLVGPGGYLQTWPNNPSYYTISLGANGTVYVTPAPGTPGHALGEQDYETYEVPGVGNICATI